MCNNGTGCGEMRCDYFTSSYFIPAQFCCCYQRNVAMESKSDENSVSNESSACILSKFEH